MGYTTDFKGSLKFNKPLTIRQLKTIQEFDGKRPRSNLYVGSTMPDSWCDWAVDDLGESIAWNGSEKSYHMFEWLMWLRSNLLSAWGIVLLDGIIEASGEERNDRWAIICKDGILKKVKGKITYEK